MEKGKEGRRGEVFEGNRVRFGEILMFSKRKVFVLK